MSSSEDDSGRGNHSGFVRASRKGKNEFGSSVWKASLRSVHVSETTYRATIRTVSAEEMAVSTRTSAVLRAQQG